MKTIEYQKRMQFFNMSYKIPNVFFSYPMKRQNPTCDKLAHRTAAKKQ